MKLINYFGEEFEREEPLTDRKIKMLKNTMEIYIAMGSTNEINVMLKTLTLEEAKLIGSSATKNYIIDSMKYI